MNALKKCTECGESKSFKHFYKATNSRDGYQGKCKECYSKNNIIEGVYTSDETRNLYGFPRRYSWNIPDKKVQQELNLSMVLKNK